MELVDALSTTFVNQNVDSSPTPSLKYENKGQLEELVIDSLIQYETT